MLTDRFFLYFLLLLQVAAGRGVMASDFYSLGATALFLLTAKPPQLLMRKSSTCPFQDVISELLGNGTIQDEMADTLVAMLSFDPADRMQAVKKIKGVVCVCVILLKSSRCFQPLHSLSHSNVPLPLLSLCVTGMAYFEDSKPFKGVIRTASMRHSSRSSGGASARMAMPVLVADDEAGEAIPVISKGSQIMVQAKMIADQKLHELGSSGFASFEPLCEAVKLPTCKLQCIV
jgi:serine/threonine protein kinase